MIQEIGSRISERRHRTLAMEKRKSEIEDREMQMEAEIPKGCNLLGTGATPIGLAEFSWDEQGFSLMSSLCSDMALNIDDKMR